MTVRSASSLTKQTPGANNEPVPFLPSRVRNSAWRPRRRNSDGTWKSVASPELGPELGHREAVQFNSLRRVDSPLGVYEWVLNQIRHA